MNTKKYHKKTILQVVPALVSGGVERGRRNSSDARVNLTLCGATFQWQLEDMGQRAAGHCRQKEA